MTDQPLHIEGAPVPEPGERCSAFARRTGATTLGTGIAASAVLVIDVPTPWPHKIEDEPTIATVPNLTGLVTLAAVPREDHPLMATLYLREASGSASVWTLPFLDSRPEDWERLAECLDWAAGGPIQAEWWEPAGWTQLQPKRTWLICTHGSRDVCCGSKGASFALDVRQRLGGAEQRRVSHLGGHRFAPTVLEMPSGRTWAYATSDLIQAREAGQLPTGAGDMGRGWWGAPPGAGQVAEWAAMTEVLGVSSADDPGTSRPIDTFESPLEHWDVSERTVHSRQIGHTTFEVVVTNPTSEVVVTVEKTGVDLIPACGVYDGAHKSTPAFSITSVARVR